MLVFIGAAFPDAALLPDLRSNEGLRCLEWLGWLSSTLHGAFLQQWRPERFLPAAAAPGPLVDHGHRLVRQMVGEIEARSGSPWLLGARYSVADIYAFIFYGWGNRVGLEMSRVCPGWTAQVARMLERAPVRAALEAEGIGDDHYRAPQPTAQARSSDGR